MSLVEYDAAPSAREAVPARGSCNPQGASVAPRAAEQLYMRGGCGRVRPGRGTDATGLKNVLKYTLDIPPLYLYTTCMEVVMNDSRITLYLDKDMKLALENWAKVERRSLNSLILRELDRLLNQRYEAVDMSAQYLLSGKVPK
jgi:hypothetical protein